MSQSKENIPEWSVAEREKVRARVEEIDFCLIKRKLESKEDGEGWDKSFCAKIEQTYRRFLFLVAIYSRENQRLVPTAAVDTFWHYHILDTRKYALDCEKVFGYFLHHNPYFGLDRSNEEERAKFENSSRRTADLYFKEFDGDFVEESICATEVVSIYRNKVKVSDAE